MLQSINSLGKTNNRKCCKLDGSPIGLRAKTFYINIILLNKPHLINPYTNRDCSDWDQWDLNKYLLILYL